MSYGMRLKFILIGLSNRSNNNTDLFSKYDAMNELKKKQPEAKNATVKTLKSNAQILDIFHTGSLCLYVLFLWKWKWFFILSHLKILYFDIYHINLYLAFISNSAKQGWSSAEAGFEVTLKWFSSDLNALLQASAVRKTSHL